MKRSPYALLTVLLAAISLAPKADAQNASYLDSSPYEAVSPARGGEVARRAGGVPPDTSTAVLRATLRLEHARLTRARTERAEASGWRRLRPRLDLYASLSTRGLAFPSVSSRGYDPAYAAVARWPGDTWGVTLSWSLDQLLDRAPAAQARTAVAVAEARIALAHTRHEEARRRAEQRARERAALALREAERLHAERGFLERTLGLQRELLRLAELEYEQGETGHAALVRQRLATLGAERALAACERALSSALTALAEPRAADYPTLTATRTP